MRVTKKIKPGADGSKRFVKLYADQLVCVRYRVYSQKNKRYTTIELIAEEVNIPPPRSEEIKRILPHPLQTVSIKVDFSEIETRNQIKNCGGKWDKKEKAWKLAYRMVQKLRMTNRIVWLDKDIDMPNNGHQIHNSRY